MIVGKKTIGNTGYAAKSKPKLNPRHIMDIRVARNLSIGGKKATIGRMTVDSVWICYTLEDPCREPLTARPQDAIALAAWVRSWKVFGRTAIPRGTYRVIMHDSPHFGRLMPMLVDVPGYSTVYFHPGNTANDTEGCILVGFTLADDHTIGGSRGAFAALYSQIEEAINAGQKVWCTVG